MMYLDHAAATPVDPRVLKSMLPYFSEAFANPSSVYQFALRNRQAVDSARKKVADVLACRPDEIFFTGSGTESNNWAVFGVAEAFRKKGMHLVTTVIEHHSVLNPMEELDRRGWEVTYLPVDENGRTDLKKLEKTLKPHTALVSIAYANNEIGTVEDIAGIAQIIRNHNVRNGTSTLFHTDACQAAGALPVKVKELGVDLMTLNGGKIYGPKGSGVLYIRNKVNIVPLLYGGGQEHRQRAGTENVPAIVGFAEALSIAESMRGREARRLTAMRDELINGLRKNIPDTALNGDPANRLPNNVNVSFHGVDAESLLVRLDMEGVCASAGSACTSGALEPSHVLMALGVEKDLAKSSIRMTLGRENTVKDIKKLLALLPRLVEDLRMKRK
jgi:cysteine desulfurase